MTASARPRVAATPTNFGVQRILPRNAWGPDADIYVDTLRELGYDGTALGPPGYLGTRAELDSRLTTRALVLAEAFLPFHFSRSEVFEDEFAALPELLSLLTDRGDDRPYAVLSEGFREPGRWTKAGRVANTRDERLPPRRFMALMSNLHRAAEACIASGLRPVLHHHAGTLIETDYEIRRVLEAMDTTRIGLCLDTAHAWIGRSDPLQLIDDFRDVIRHVHVKDLSLDKLAHGNAQAHDLSQLTLGGAFVPLGTGDAGVAEIVATLTAYGYSGWFVIEQDRFLLDRDTFQTVVREQRHNLTFMLDRVGSRR